MKPYLRTFFILAVTLLFKQGASEKVFANPVVAYDIQAGPFYSLTALPDLIPAIQSGWDIKFSVSFETKDAFQSSQEARLVESNRTPIFLMRLQGNIFGLETSFPQADGNLYRAWQGIGLTGLFGVRSSAFMIPVIGRLASARLEAGAGLWATKYSGTGLVSANTSIVSQLGLDIIILEHFTFGINLPIELAWKSGGTAFMFGIGAAIRYW